jgi:hypothetical protein
VAVPTHYLKKRDLLWSPKTPPATLAAVGREFLKLEAYSDALDFFERAKDEDGVQEIKRLALKLGDTFLLSRLERYRRDMITPEEWAEAQRVAAKREVFSMAAYAERKLKPPEKAAPETALPGATPLDESAEAEGEKPKS